MSKGLAMSKQNKGDVWTTMLFSVLLLAALAITSLGIYVAAIDQTYVVLAVGVLSVILAAGMALMVQRSGGGVSDRAEVLLEQILSRLQQSELERRVIDREHDREHLRRAILADIGRGDFEGGLALVDEMADQFGYREEAEQYRQQILDARSRKQENVLDEAIAKVDRHCLSYNWEGAHREVDRLLRLYPEVARVQQLPMRLDAARYNHKQQLEREFLAASEAGNVDTAMNLLKELDLYLSPEEAENYVEVARGVVGQARENLGVRFKMAVTDRDWIAALRVGDQIIREFPNTKMADEVRQMMDMLRERAKGQQEAQAGSAI